MADADGDGLALTSALGVAEGAGLALASAEGLAVGTAVGLAEGGEIHLPLTQEEIGDATGLTAVHVNRMMRSLVDDGIIERNGGGMVRILDDGRLCIDANYTDRTLIDASWLPPAA